MSELHNGGGVAAETVFLHEERHEDAVYHQHEVVSIDAVEDIVVEEKGNLPLHAVGLAQFTNLIDFFFLNHALVIFAPSALRRASIFS